MSATPEITRYADLIMAEIDADIASGQIPSTVASFSELHEHVDANEYITDAGYYWENTDESMTFVNTVEAEVTKRLQARQS